jgi:hypothetical protein
MHGLNAEFVQPSVVAAKTVAGAQFFTLAFKIDTTHWRPERFAHNKLHVHAT